VLLTGYFAISGAFVIQLGLHGGGFARPKTSVIFYTFWQ